MSIKVDPEAFYRRINKVYSSWKVSDADNVKAVILVLVQARHFRQDDSFMSKTRSGHVFGLFLRLSLSVGCVGSFAPSYDSFCSFWRLRNVRFQWLETFGGKLNRFWAQFLPIFSSFYWKYVFLNMVMSIFRMAATRSSPRWTPSSWPSAPTRTSSTRSRPLSRFVFVDLPSDSDEIWYKCPLTHVLCNGATYKVLLTLDLS